MGHGSYRASDWVKLKDSRGISATSSASTIFRSSGLKDKYNPKFIQMRESCDSEDSPAATPIIIGFDVTGSMGYLAEEIAKNALNKTILSLYDKKPVSNPHIMCAAIGDVCDSAPLQVTQFEADIRIAEQLMDLWLEMRGGDLPESYNLLWYFADQHTRTDAFEKREAKGFLFTIGDAPVHPQLSKDDLKKVFQDDVQSNISNQQLLKAVSQKYHTFHIVTKSMSPLAEWNSLMPGHVAYIDGNHIGYLSEVITSIIQVANGMNKTAVIAQWPQEVQPVIMKALKTIAPDKQDSSDAAQDSQKPVPDTAAPKKSFFGKLFRK